MKTSVEQKLNQKIKEVSQELGVGDVNRVRVILALERLVARLEANQFLAERLIFCGGFVLFHIAETGRFTSDVDAIASGVSREKIDQEILSAAEKNLDDGFWFKFVDIQELQAENGYGGVRYRFRYKIGELPTDERHFQQLSQLHLDISLGVSLGVRPNVQKLESIVKYHEPIVWKVYPLECIAAEKIHALISRRGASTRAKDIFDLSLILKRCQNIQDLIKAVESTFKRRGDSFPKSYYEEAIRYDVDLLARVWSKVQIPNRRVDFQKCWDNLLEEFKRLDRFNSESGNE